MIESEIKESSLTQNYLPVKITKEEQDQIVTSMSDLIFKLKNTQLKYGDDTLIDLFRFYPEKIQTLKYFANLSSQNQKNKDASCATPKSFISNMIAKDYIGPKQNYLSKMPNRLYFDLAIGEVDLGKFYLIQKIRFRII